VDRQFADVRRRDAVEARDARARGDEGKKMKKSFEVLPGFEPESLDYCRNPSARTRRSTGARVWTLCV